MYDEVLDQFKAAPKLRIRYGRYWRSLAAVTAVVVFLGACTSTDDPETTQRTSDDAVAQAASEIIEPALDRPSEIAVTEPLDGEVPTDVGPVYWIECGSPACVALGDALQEATDLLGWELVRVSAGLSPETIKNAWGEAARARPEPVAVLGSGFSREIFEPELDDLASRDIPTFNISVDDEPGDGLTAVLGAAKVRNSEVGRLQAAYLLSRNGSKTNAVFVLVPGLSSQPIQREGFAQEFADLCADCKMDSLEVPAESIGTDLPQRLVSYLRANPDVNSVAITFGDMAIGVPTALRDAGLAERVEIVTDTPDPTVAQYIKDNNVVLAATAYPGPELMWRGIDITLRSLTGQDIRASADAAFPRWLMTSDTIPSTTESFPIIVDYQEQYRELWGLR